MVRLTQARMIQEATDPLFRGERGGIERQRPAMLANGLRMLCTTPTRTYPSVSSWRSSDCGRDWARRVRVLSYKGEVDIGGS